MEKLDKILHSALAGRGIKKTLDSAHVCFLAEEWSKGVFTVVSFSRGVLKLSVSSSPAAQDLQMRQEELMNYLNAKLDKKVVYSIRIVQNHLDKSVNY